MRPCWSRSSPFPSPVGPAGIEPASHRVADDCLAAQPRPEESPCTRIEPVFPGRQPGRCTPASSQGKQSAWRESNPPVRHGEPVPRPLGHRRITNTSSKGGRSRTLCACFGGRLLSREHTLVGQRKGQDSNLQGLFASPGFQPGAIVPVGSPFRPQLPRQDSNLQPSR